MKFKNYVFEIIVIATLTIFSACSSSSSQSDFLVSKIIDGNTVQFDNGSVAKLVGISPTPSSHTWLEKNVLNQVVRLLPDKQSISPDYVAAYLFNLNGLCINAQMLHEKIAVVDVSYNYDSLSTFKQYGRSAIVPINERTGTAPSQLVSLPTLIKQVEQSVFFVVREEKDGLGFGSGFFISENGIAITNHHVYHGFQNGFIKLLNGDVYHIDNVLAENEDLDYVIFTIENPNNTAFPYLKIANNIPQKGEEIFVIGNPRGLQSSVTKGIVSNINSEKEGYIQIDAAVSPGNSGGPVFDMQGEVVGLVTFRRMGCENCNFALDIHNISELSQYTPQ